MNDLNVWAAFLGWCAVLNIGMLLFATVMLVLFSGFIKNIHGKLFRLSESELDIIYFKYLAYYKIGILLFNLAPYIALRIMQ